MPAIPAWRRLLVAVPILLVMTLALSLFAATSAEAHKSQRERKIHHGLKVALHQKGDPYSYGSAGPGAFDCSGLTMFSYGKAGLYLPRSSDDQARFVRHIPKKNLHRGDFVFFHSGGHVYHVAIYLGRHHGKRFILHAPHSGTVVQRDPIWTSSWYAGTLRHRP
jgi:cell wall-associated NlpC family hydrolase